MPGELLPIGTRPTLVASFDPPQTVRAMIVPAWHGKVAFANPLVGTAAVHVAALWTLWSEALARGFFLQMQHNAVRVAVSGAGVAASIRYPSPIVPAWRRTAGAPRDAFARQDA